MAFAFVIEIESEKNAFLTVFLNLSIHAAPS